MDELLTDVPVSAVLELQDVWQPATVDATSMAMMMEIPFIAGPFLNDTSSYYLNLGAA
ncbi:hypothetical protein [Paraburkholderia sediminicola]|uniref:hypothetical protein n=1 Tax=Paraburkholderia sediminicola TaxID=458836 RepID=UPI0038B9D738